MTEDVTERGLATIPGAPSALSVLRQAGQLGMEVPKPFSQPICLIDEARVAGTRFVEDIDLVTEDLHVGDRLTFVRDAHNLHDRWAVRVRDAKGRGVGFFPADQVEIIARLMDGGKRIYGTVTQLEVIEGWYRIKMAVMLDD